MNCFVRDNMLLKKILLCSILLVAAIHAVLLAYCYISRLAALWGLLMQLMYFQFLNRFPLVKLKSTLCISTLGKLASLLSKSNQKSNFMYIKAGIVVHKFIWFNSGEANNLFLLFVCVWMIPYSLIVLCDPIEASVHPEVRKKAKRMSCRQSHRKISLMSLQSAFSKGPSESLRRLLSVS
jgi:hypothetical protein